MTAREAVATFARRLSAAGIADGDARFEAKILVLQAAGMTPESLHIAGERQLDDDVVEAANALVSRRTRREPLAYIQGFREFYGMAIRVTPAVLIPRPETEFVVQAILDYVGGCRVCRVVDVGTGSGAIAVAVALSSPNARLWATDLSSAALSIARRNAADHGVTARIDFAEGDLLTPVVSNAPFDVIASNPPYIAPGEIDALEPEVRDWEPRIALGTHADPLHFYRRLAREATPLLAPGGLLVVEVGLGQSDAVAELWQRAGLTAIAVTDDYATIPRIVSGRALGIP